MNQKPERRADRTGEIAMMAYASGYCMVRRPKATPFVVTRVDWQRLPPATAPAEERSRYLVTRHGLEIDGELQR